MFVFWSHTHWRRLMWLQVKDHWLAILAASRANFCFSSLIQHKFYDFVCMYACFVSFVELMTRTSAKNFMKLPMNYFDSAREYVICHLSTQNGTSECFHKKIHSSHGKPSMCCSSHLQNSKKDEKKIGWKAHLELLFLFSQTNTGPLLASSCATFLSVRLCIRQFTVDCPWIFIWTCDHFRIPESTEKKCLRQMEKLIKKPTLFCAS